MSSSGVATVAWLGLAGVVLLGAAAGWLYHRLVVLGRAHTDGKWEIVVLRAEVGALRREVRGTTYPALPVGSPSSDGPPSADGSGAVDGSRSADRSAGRADDEPEDDGARNGRRPSSPTAWRRDRARRIARPRRRRPG